MDLMEVSFLYHIVRILGEMACILFILSFVLPKCCSNSTIRKLLTLNLFFYCPFLNSSFGYVYNILIKSSSKYPCYICFLRAICIYQVLSRSIKLEAADKEALFNNLVLSGTKPQYWDPQ